MGRMKDLAMMRDADLFGHATAEALARHTDPDTSKDAARSIDDKRLSNLQQKVVNALRIAGNNGLTNDGLVEMTGEDWKTITPRVKPLRKLGYVETRNNQYGNVITRTGKAGRQQVVWFLAP